jgi:hypothetical protein
MSIGRLAVVIIALAGCYRTSDVRGSALLDMQPAPPAFESKYDFDLLEQVRGKACVKRTTRRMAYWAGSFAFKVPTDALTQSAISAASMDALDEVPEADTILITRVITEGKSSDQACAWVFGRAVKIRKAGESDEEPEDEDEPGKPAGDEPQTEPGVGVWDLPRPPR